MNQSEEESSVSKLYGVDDLSFKAAGEYEGIKNLVNDFYDYMESMPVAKIIRDMHPEDLTESREKLTRFLCGWLGGPKLYSQKYGPIKIPLAHLHLFIEEPERDAWLLCMQKAVNDQPFDQSFKDYFMEQIYVPAERIRSVGEKKRKEKENQE